MMVLRYKRCIVSFSECCIEMLLREFCWSVTTVKPTAFLLRLPEKSVYVNNA